jgi:hypothetical protein
VTRNKGRKASKDPLVPVYGSKVRAAMAEGRIRMADLARKLKTSPQALAYLAEGDGIKRCRASRRADLAKALKVTEQWLSEPIATLLPLWLAGVTVATGSGVFTFARTQLALGRLLRKCVDAIDRDLQDKTLRDRGIEETATPDDVKEGVARCIRQLTDLDLLRGDVLVGVEQPFAIIPLAGGILTTRHNPFAAEEEAAGVELISSWEQMLELWFSGKAKLNYRRLSERAGFPVPDGERRSDTNPFIIVSPKGA